MKKTTAILGMIACIAVVTACGSSGNETTYYGGYTEEQILEAGIETLASFDSIVAADSASLYESMDVIYDGLLNYMDALEEIGTVIGTDGGSVEDSSEGVIIDVNIVGSDHDAVMEIVLTEDLQSYTSITTNVTYSMGERMAKAALNTVIGLVTVFVVLIIISLIIYAMKLIPKAQAAMNHKKETPQTPAAETPAQVAETSPAVTQTAETPADDEELIAVIAAAVAAYESETTMIPADGFVVRSIRKVRSR